jgi:hypothetical protein
MPIVSKLRIKKVGKPTWSGKLYWIGASEQGWSESRSLVIDEPEYDANGVATLTIHDIDWRASTTIRRFRFDFLKNQSDTNNLLIDWIAVGDRRLALAWPLCRMRSPLVWTLMQLKLRTAMPGRPDARILRRQ